MLAYNPNDVVSMVVQPEAGGTPMEVVPEEQRIQETFVPAPSAPTTDWTKMAFGALAIYLVWKAMNPK